MPPANNSLTVQSSTPSSLVRKAILAASGENAAARTGDEFNKMNFVFEKPKLILAKIEMFLLVSKNEIFEMISNFPGNLESGVEGRKERCSEQKRPP